MLGALAWGSLAAHSLVPAPAERRPGAGGAVGRHSRSPWPWSCEPVPITRLEPTVVDGCAGVIRCATS